MAGPQKNIIPNLTIPEIFFWRGNRNLLVSKNHWIAYAKEQRAKQKFYNRSQELESWKVICLFPATWNLEIRWIFDKPFLFRDEECHWMKEEAPVCFWERLVYFGSLYLAPSRLLKFALKRKQFQIYFTHHRCFSSYQQHLLFQPTPSCPVVKLARSQRFWEVKKFSAFWCKLDQWISFFSPNNLKDTTFTNFWLKICQNNIKKCVIMYNSMFYNN